MSDYEKGFRKGYWHGFHEVLDLLEEGADQASLYTFLWDELGEWWKGECSRPQEPPMFSLEAKEVIEDLEALNSKPVCKPQEAP